MSGSPIPEFEFPPEIRRTIGALEYLNPHTHAIRCLPTVINHPMHGRAIRIYFNTTKVPRAASAGHNLSLDWAWRADTSSLATLGSMSHGAGSYSRAPTREYWPGSLAIFRRGSTECSRFRRW